VKVSFVVYGHPAAQGSSRAFVPKGWTRPIITSANPKLKSWRQEMCHAAKEAIFESSYTNWPIPAGIPVALTLRLYFKPPKKEKRKYKPTRPDADKNLRAIGDSLSGIVIHDDSQIAIVHMEKLFGIPERVEIEVSECETNGTLF